MAAHAKPGPYPISSPPLMNGRQVDELRCREFQLSMLWIRIGAVRRSLIDTGSFSYIHMQTVPIMGSAFS